MSVTIELEVDEMCHMALFYRKKKAKHYVVNKKEERKIETNILKKIQKNLT